MKTIEVEISYNYGLTGTRDTRTPAAEASRLFLFSFEISFYTSSKILLL